MTVIGLLKASFAICFAACLFITGSCLVMEARVDCDRTDARFSCSRIGLVTVSHPDDLKFDINGVQEVTVRVLPPSGKVFRFRPIDTFSLTAGVDFMSRKCNVTQQYNYAVSSQTIPIRFIGASRSPSVDVASGQVAYQEGKQYPDMLATFSASVSFVMGTGDSFLAKSFEATIPLSGNVPKANCHLQDWKGNMTGWMSTFTSSYYLNGRNMRVLSLVDEDTRVDRFGVPLVDDEEDLREERDFREAQQRNGTGDAADASGRDAPKDPFSDWFSAAPSTASSGLVNCLLASISVLVANQLL